MIQESAEEKRQALYILLLALFLGTLVRIYNLDDGRFLWTDEWMTLQWFNKRYPFLNAGYKISTLIWGSYDSVVLYTSAFWGVVSIILTFLIGRVLFNSRTGSYAAFFLSLFTVHVIFSRSGFSPAFQSVLILSAFLSFLFYLKGNHLKHRYLVITGILCGLSFFVYNSSYSAIAAFIFLLIAFLIFEGASFKEVFFELAILGASMLSVVILAEVISLVSYQKSFVGQLLANTQEQQGWLYTKNHLPKFRLHYTRPLIFFQKIVKYGGYFQAELIVFGFLYAVRDWFRTRNKNLLLLLGFISFSAFIFSLLGSPLFAKHVIFPRHYVYLIPFFCLCVAYFLDKIETPQNKKTGLIFLLVFTCLSLPESFPVISSTFKVRPINIWLVKHKIDKSQVATLINLSEREYPPNTRPLPHIDYKILNWTELRKLYNKNKIRYILTSGIGTNCQVGIDDQVLKKFRPLKTWTHPYHLPNNWRYTSETYTELSDYPRVGDFAFYDLKTIFASISP